MQVHYQDIMHTLVWAVDRYFFHICTALGWKLHCLIVITITVIVLLAVPIVMMLVLYVKVFICVTIIIILLSKINS